MISALSAENNESKIFYLKRICIKYPANGCILFFSASYWKPITPLSFLSK
jgi:polyphosphate kinase 2 (PPK2 family)